MSDTSDLENMIINKYNDLYKSYDSIFSTKSNISKKTKELLELHDKFVDVDNKLVSISKKIAMSEIIKLLIKHITSNTLNKKKFDHTFPKTVACLIKFVHFYQNEINDDTICHFYNTILNDNYPYQNSTHMLMPRYLVSDIIWINLNVHIYQLKAEFKCNFYLDQYYVENLTPIYHEHGPYPYIKDNIHRERHTDMFWNQINKLKLFGNIVAEYHDKNQSVRFDVTKLNNILKKIHDEPTRNSIMNFFPIESCSIIRTVIFEFVFKKLSQNVDMYLCDINNNETFKIYFLKWCVEFEKYEIVDKFIYDSSCETYEPHSKKIYTYSTVTDTINKVIDTGLSKNIIIDVNLLISYMMYLHEEPHEKVLKFVELHGNLTNNSIGLYYVFKNHESILHLLSSDILCKNVNDIYNFIVPRYKFICSIYSEFVDIVDTESSFKHNYYSYMNKYFEYSKINHANIIARNTKTKSVEIVDAIVNYIPVSNVNTIDLEFDIPESSAQ